MKIIKATNGQDIQVDDCYYDYLSQFTWSMNKKTGYAMSRMGANAKTNMAYLHIWVATQEGIPTSGVVDHKDRNTLNNQAHNLRPATVSQNAANSNFPPGKYSEYRGVTWAKRYNKWFAQLQVNKKAALAKYFKDEVEAAKAYDRAAFEHFGEFATLNFPEDYAHLLGN